MIFANPLGLLGLISLPIILGLHMLRERSKTIPISSLALWKFLEPEVRGSRFQRIPLTWLLIVDLLIALLLSLALAQPRFMINRPVTSMIHHVVIVDNSLSMQSDDVLPDRISQAKLAAINLINGAGPKDVVTIIAFNANPILVGDSRQNSIQDLIRQVTDLKSTLVGHALKESMVMGISLLDELPPHFYVISDHSFQQPDLFSFTYPLTWIQVGLSTNNQSISKLAVEWIGDNQLQVFARIKNYHTESVQRMTTLLLNGNPYDSQNLNLPPGTDIDLVWQVLSKPNYICVSLIGDDALGMDDQRCLGLTDQSKIQVIFVTDDSGQELEVLKKNPIYQALTAVPNLELKLMKPTDYSPLMDSNWTIFHNTVPSDWPTGVVTVFLSPNLLQDSSSNLIALQGQKSMITPNQSLEIIGDDQLLMDIDLNGLRWGNALEIDEIKTNLLPLLTADDLPLILKDVSNRQPIYIFITDMVSGNLIQHPAFPLMFINLADLAQSSALPVEIQIGDPLPLPDTGNFQSLQIIAPNGKKTTYPSTWPTEINDIYLPGVYQVNLKNNDGMESESYVGINVGSEEESDLTFKTRENLSGIESSSNAIDSNQTIDLFPWLLGFSILLMMVEARLAWR
jgi:hypothetical protein